MRSDQNLQPTLIDVPAAFTQPKVMVTAHREIQHPELVRSRCEHVLTKLDASLAISGGAEGGDTLFAEAAVATGVPLQLVLPNRLYRKRYPRAVSDELVRSAAEVVYVVDREETSDWRTRWDNNRWWRDNFVRNRAMLEAADVWCVISPRRPSELAKETKGGTAACVKEAIRIKPGGQMLWIPDDPELSVRWVRLHG